MKRVGHLYERICDLDNIATAISRASQGKRNRPFVKRVTNAAHEHAQVIQDMLANKSYIPSPYAVKVIKDGATQKERTIHKPRFFPDQVIHWALMLQLQPVMMRGMYEYSCGSVPGRGTSYGQKVVRRWLDSDYKGTKYCLKLDIRKFYPSIDHDVLKAMLRRKLKDENCLWLLDTVIDSVASGLPIGNYTSQWLSNFFLEGLDHFIKETLGIKYYVRYVDDLVLLGPNKKTLHKARVAIADYLSGIRLSLKDNWQVFLVNARAIDFLGLRFYRDHTTLRRRNALRMRRRLKKIAKKRFLNYSDACAVVSYWGWVKRSDSYRFYHRHIRSQVKLSDAKRVISNHAKRRQHSGVQSNCGVRDHQRDTPSPV